MMSGTFNIIDLPVLPVLPEFLVFIMYFLYFRTIYVPFENTVNVPDVFDVSVGSSFGYSGPPQSSSKVPTANGASSYDNPISSFDAPIYDENSYTADAVSFVYKANDIGNSNRDHTTSSKRWRLERFI